MLQDLINDSLSLHNMLWVSIKKTTTSCPLTFSGELKGEDGPTLFKGSRLPHRCLNVNGNAVKDGLAKRKIHPLRGIKLMIGIAGIHAT